MAYFLKKSNYKKGTYIQIYESFYDPERKYSAHKCYKSLGYIDELKTDKIKDPIAYYKEVVNKLNEERNKKLNDKKDKKISISPKKNLGYFPIKNLMDSFKLKPLFNLLQINRNFKFSTLDLLESLVYSRLIYPCSKHKTSVEIFNKLYNNYDISLNQIYSGINFLGQEYQKIIEIFNHKVSEKYMLDTTNTFFDCTNFYFEIDKEDDLRKKGPSKENRKSPIVSMGLLLDSNQIPISMKIFPGNESEKPVIRDVINDMKRKNNIKGKTVQVADKGLNSGTNIYNAIKAKDGYIFSKAVKSLPKKELQWIFINKGDYVDVKDSNGNVLYKYKSCVDDFPYVLRDDNGKIIKSFNAYEKRIVTYNPKLAKKQRREINKEINKAKNLSLSHAKKSEYGDCAKYMIFKSTDNEGKNTDNKVAVSMNDQLINKHLSLAGYNMLVTSEINMNERKIYDTYHELWRIEETFKVMKSDLDARPVYLQDPYSIKGHFLVCYISVLLLRLLQIKVFKDEYSTNELVDFIKNFKVIEISPRKFINITDSSEFITKLTNKLDLPLNSYYLSSSQIKDIMNVKFK